MSHSRSGLPEIPVVEVHGALGFDTLAAEESRAHALIDAATRHVPRAALHALDRVSRRWLDRWNHAQLAEIDRVAEFLDRPGAYFLSVNYEWGCTCRVSPSPEETTARLARVLDWRTPGLGKNVIAARVCAPAGPFAALTWPGYTGVLQAVAKGRFAAALNQAPMRRPIGLFALDWAANKARVWSRPHPTPAHLLRETFETAPDFQTALEMLTERPVAAPCIYVLSGVAPQDTAVIERDEERAAVRSGPCEATNHWNELGVRTSGWRGSPRGFDSPGRAAAVAGLAPDFEPGFTWLSPPVLNPLTRLAMVADAAEGRLIAQGYEDEAAATAPLDLRL